MSCSSLDLSVCTGFWVPSSRTVYSDKFSHPWKTLCIKLQVTCTVLSTPRFTHWIVLLWNRLPRIKRLLGGWPIIGLLFICLPTVALFSSNLPVSCQFREFLSLINIRKHSFHQFQGLRRPGQQSTSIIHFTRKSTIYMFFRPIGWFWLFYGWKTPKFGRLGVWLLAKNWATLKSLAMGKKANLKWFGPPKFWQHWTCMTLFNTLLRKRCS